MTYFDQEIEDEIFFDLATFSGYLQSPGTSTSKGIEIAADVPLGERWELLDELDEQRRGRLRRISSGCAAPRTSATSACCTALPNERLGFIANYRSLRTPSTSAA